MLTLTGTVLITGGAGFLGRGILNRALKGNWPAKFIVYSRDQQKHELVKRRYAANGVDVRCVLGDIAETERLTNVMVGCDAVIHAAALKHLPECEAQPSQALRVNVGGTCSVFAAADMAGVKRVVMISTDKAASPMNTYGMTKALCERLVFESAEFPSLGGVKLVGVRYGNVIGSTGSVWHAFNEQRKSLGQLLVTDPIMTRFFIDIDSAIDVILNALSSRDGLIIIPKPRALSIGALAEYLTGLWGLAKAETIGQRPGEKSHEVMVDFAEQRRLETWHNDTYALHGPTDPFYSFANHTGFSSSDADVMRPEEFVSYAMASEAV